MFIDFSLKTIKKIVAIRDNAPIHKNKIFIKTQKNGIQKMTYPCCFYQSILPNLISLRFCREK